MDIENEKKTGDLPATAGFDSDGVTFDSHGEVTGLPDEVMQSVAGGLMVDGYNSVCPEVNFNCAC